MWTDLSSHKRAPYSIADILFEHFHTETGENDDKMKVVRMKILMKTMELIILVTMMKMGQYKVTLVFGLPLNLLTLDLVFIYLTLSPYTSYLFIFLILFLESLI